MSNPFSAPSASNYNSSPPPDNGAETAANEITWAGIKTKLADPIYNWLNDTLTNITSAFGKIFLNSVSSVSANYTVQTSDQGKLLNCSNTITVTLLAAATAGSNFTLAIRNAGSGTVTIDGDGSEEINGATTLALSPGAHATLACNGSAWTALNTQVSRDGTETLTNKTLTSPTIGGTIAGTPTVSGIWDFTANPTINSKTVSKVHKGTFTASALAAGGQSTATVTHGLGTDDVHIFITGDGSTNENWFAYGQRYDDTHVIYRGAGNSATRVIGGASLATGNVRVSVFNDHSSSQDITINYMIIG